MFVHIVGGVIELEIHLMANVDIVLKLIAFGAACVCVCALSAFGIRLSSFTILFRRAPVLCLSVLPFVNSSNCRYVDGSPSFRFEWKMRSDCCNFCYIFIHLLLRRLRSVRFGMKRV